VNAFTQFQTFEIRPCSNGLSESRTLLAPDDAVEDSGVPDSCPDSLPRSREAIPSAKLDRFLKRGRIETPYVVIDLDLVAERYSAMRRSLPRALIYYAVKAHPESAILRRLHQLGAKFDVASIAELRRCLSAGASPEQISYGNTIKKERDIARAYRFGVRMFSFDSLSELRKLAVHAPGSRVCCRLLIQAQGAQSPLGRKFGCDSDMACDLLKLSRQLGLVPQGLVFHVGSQQADPSEWSAPIHVAAQLFSKLAREGINLELLNLGGGLPAHYRSGIPSHDVYVSEIMRAIRRSFGGSEPMIVVEPGRSLVADAGVIQTEVVLISKKSYSDAHRWVFLDIGKFGGLIETLDESIKYRFRTPHDGKPAGRVILAGPTCDSADILYEKSSYDLPLDLKEGDRVEILSAGAYTHTYASICLNGLPSLRAYCI
jgi:ornithine decarboxylase